MKDLADLLNKELDYQRQQYMSSEARAYRIAAGVGIVATLLISAITFASKAGVDLPLSWLVKSVLSFGIVAVCVGIVFALLAMLPHISTTGSLGRLSDSVETLKTERQCFELLLRASTQDEANRAIQLTRDLLFGMTEHEGEDPEDFTRRARLGRILVFRTALSIRMLLLQIAIGCVIASVMTVFSAGIVILIESW